jgi:hypothetical protein
MGAGQAGSNLFAAAGANPELFNSAGINLGNLQGAIYNKILSQTHQNFTQGGMLTGDNGLYNYAATSKFRKETVETYGDTNKLLKVEKIQENNLINGTQADDNNLIQIAHNPS